MLDGAEASSTTSVDGVPVPELEVVVPVEDDLPLSS
jgi:hypothetical protein